jgi:hypothetical protein
MLHKHNAKHHLYADDKQAYVDDLVSKLPDARNALED